MKKHGLMKGFSLWLCFSMLAMSFFGAYPGYGEEILPEEAALFEPEGPSKTVGDESDIGSGDETAGEAEPETETAEETVSAGETEAFREDAISEPPSVADIPAEGEISDLTADEIIAEDEASVPKAGKNPGVFFASTTPEYMAMLHTLRDDASLRLAVMTDEDLHGNFDFDSAVYYDGTYVLQFESEVSRDEAYEILNGYYDDKLLFKDALFGVNFEEDHDEGGETTDIECTRETAGSIEESVEEAMKLSLSAEEAAKLSDGTEDASDVSDMEEIFTEGENREDEPYEIDYELDLSSYEFVIPEGSLVAIIDTGVDSAKISEVVQSVNLTADGNEDINGHGTRMARHILGYVSDIDILSIKALGDDGTGSAINLQAAVRYAREAGADYILTAFSSRDAIDASLFKEEVLLAIDEGIHVVASAGNSGVSASRYIPAGIEGVMTAGSIDEDGSIRDFSNRGSSVDYYVVSDSTSEAAAKLLGMLIYVEEHPESDIYFEELMASDTREGDEEDGLGVLVPFAAFGVDSGPVYVDTDRVRFESMTASWNGSNIVLSFETYSKYLCSAAWIGCLYGTSKRSGTLYIYISSDAMTYFGDLKYTANAIGNITGTVVVTKNLSTLSTMMGYGIDFWVHEKYSGDYYSHHLSSVTGWDAAYGAAEGYQYTIRFDANKGSGSMGDMICTMGQAYTLSANAFTRTGYTFSSWNTSSAGTGTSYKNQASVQDLSTKKGGVATLYAQWTPISYTLRYDANAPEFTGSMADTSCTYDTAASLRTNAFAREGYVFKGWSLSPDSEEIDFEDGEKVTNLSATGGDVVTLYAVWAYDGPDRVDVTIVNSIGGNMGRNDDTFELGILILDSRKEAVEDLFEAEYIGEGTANTHSFPQGEGTLTLSNSDTLTIKDVPIGYTVIASAHDTGGYLTTFRGRGTLSGETLDEDGSGGYIVPDGGLTIELLHTQNIDVPTLLAGMNEKLSLLLLLLAVFGILFMKKFRRDSF